MFALLAAVQAALLMAMMVLNVALPEVRRALALDAAQLALVNAAYPVSFCGLLLAGGRLGDVYGHRRLFLCGCATFVCASVGVGAAVGFASLAGARFAQGVGAALAAPAALVLAGRLFPDPYARRRALGVWGGLPIVGGALGLVTAGPVVEYASWRWVGAAPVLVVALAVVAPAVRGLPAVRPERDQRVDAWGAALATVGLSACCYGLISLPSAPSPWLPLAAVALGCLALAGFAAAERRTSDPLVPPGLFGSARRLTGLVALASGAAGVFTLSYFLPLHFQQRLHLSPALTSAAYVPYAVALLTASVFSGRLTAAWGARRTALAGLLTGAGGLALLSSIGFQGSYSALLVCGMVLFPAGAVLVFSAGAVVALEGVPPSHAGVAGGLLNAAVEAGPTLGFASLVALASGATSLHARGQPASPGALSYGYGTALAATALGYAALAATARRTLRSAGR